MAGNTLVSQMRRAEAAQQLLTLFARLFCRRLVAALVLLTLATSYAVELEVGGAAGPHQFHEKDEIEVGRRTLLFFWQPCL